MPRLFASDPHCTGVTLESTGRRLNTDRSGMFSTDNPREVRDLKQAGFVVAGSTPKSGKYYLCKCGWEAWINHCPHCDSDDLKRMGRGDDA